MSALDDARVVEYPDGQRELELNEGEGVHSLYKPRSYLTGNVWDEYLVLPFAAFENPPRRDSFGTKGG